MKTVKDLIPCAALATGFLLAACSQNPSTPVGQPKLVEIQANDNMTFSITEIEVNRRQPVKVVIRNVGTMPKKSMGHNFLLVGRDTDVTELLKAAATQARNGYVPPKFASQVLASSKLLGPGESDTVEFVAPGAPGKYDFLCLFSGHAPAGMKGSLTVH